MSASTQAVGASPRIRRRPGVLSNWSPSAWGAIGVTAAFIGLTCWWLTQDRSIPVYDAGFHLEGVLYYRKLLESGDLLGPINYVSEYPPLATLVGVLAMSIGGVNVASPIIGENLVFVPLLALGCYQTGRLLFGARAGLLAVIFVLGSPLLIAQFHVFMLDAPEVALVAVSIWLILASEGFSRTRIAGWAGFAFGCGLLVKVQFPFIPAGIILTALARGGWRHWRGLTAFAAAAFAVGGFWYIDHLSDLGAIAKLAGRSSGAVPGNLPPTLSTANLTWYLWSTLNSQLLAPLFILVLGGLIWMIFTLLRRSDTQGPSLEFLVGGFVAWLAITLTPHHDIRYDMPLMPYLAVIGTGWIIHVPKVYRLIATGTLVVVVVANTVATTFGVGKQVELKLVSSPPATEALPDRIVLYSNRGFLVAGPQRDGDVPGLLDALRRSGVQVVTWIPSQSAQPDFSSEGLFPLAIIAGLEPSLEPAVVKGNPAAAELIHLPITRGASPTCTRLSDGTGVWVLRHDPESGKLEYYCPFRNPQFYPSSVQQRP